MRVREAHRLPRRAIAWRSLPLDSVDAQQPAARPRSGWQAIAPGSIVMRVARCSSALIASADIRHSRALCAAMGGRPQDIREGRRPAPEWSSAAELRLSSDREPVRRHSGAARVAPTRCPLEPVAVAGARAPDRAPDPRGPRGRRVRRPAVPGRADPARGRQRRRRLGARPPHPQERAHGPAVDRDGPRGARPARSARRDRRELRRVVDDANRAIAILNNEAPTDRQHRRLLDAGAELGALARAHAGDDHG